MRIRWNSSSRGDDASRSASKSTRPCKIEDVHAWSVGDHLTHRFNPELGTGRVTAIEGRVLVVHFPQAGATLRLAATSDALVPETGAAAAARPVAARAAGRRRRRRHRGLPDAARHPAPAGDARGGRPRLVSRRPRPAVPASAARRRARDRADAGALAARRRSRARQDHRSGADHEPAAAHAADRALPGRRARGADGAVARRAVAQVSPGVHAARCAAAGRRRARLRRRLQPVRRPSPRRDRARDADRAAGADRAGGDGRHRPARRRRGAAAAASAAGIPASRAIAPSRRLPRSAGTCCCSARRRSKTTRTGSSGCCSCCGRTSFPRTLDVEARLASGVPLPPCTSSTRRVDIGGLPPRVPVADRSSARRRTRHRCRERRLTPRRARTDPSRGGDVDRIRRALASGAALKAVLGPDETELRQQADAMDAHDPRLGGC